MSDSVIVDYKVEIGQLKARMKEVESSMRGAGDAGKKSMKDVEGGMFNVSKIGSSLKEQFTDLGKGLAAAFAVTSVINFAKSTISSFDAAAQAEAKLLNALNGRRDIQEELIKQASEIESRTIIPDEAIVQNQAFLAAQGLTVEQIKKTIEAAVQLSAVTGEDLASSTQKLAGTYEGVVGRLGKLDSAFTKLSKEQLANGGAIDLVNSKYKGFAETAAETGTGPLKQLENQFDNLKEKIGAQLVGGINNVIEVFSVFVGAADDGLTALQSLGNSAGETNKVFKGTKEQLKEAGEALVSFSILQKEQQIATLEAQDVNADKAKEQLAQLKQNFKELNEVKKEETKKDTENTDKQLNSLELLIARQGELKKQLELQSISGALNNEVLREYNDITEKLTKAQELLKNATDPVLNNIQSQAEVTAETNKAIEKDLSDLSDFKVDTADKDLENAQKNSEAVIDLSKQTNAAIQKLDEDTAEQKKQLRDAEFQASQEILTAFQDINQAALNTELSNLQEQLDAKQITQEQFDARAKAAKRKAAEDDKALAIFQTIINTAAAVAKALPNVFLSTLAAALGLIQLGVIQSQPIPAFAMGTEYVKRGKNKPGRDTIPALLNEGEAIIQTDQNSKYPGLAAAWNGGNLDKYILSNYVVPAIKEYQRNQESKMNEGFANEIAKAIVLNQKGFYDGNILDGLKKGRSLQKEQTEVLKRLLTQRSDLNQYRF